ncbi:MAG: ATP-binding protein [Paludibacteraceae bacterium]|nr:ATP-binding protein [Paludibacteraceae bacterium]
MSISKEILKRSIIEKREEVLSLDVVTRPFEFEVAGNYVFVGLRRVGKSYLLYQRMKELIAKGTSIKDILFVNFEDERLVELTTEDLDLLLEVHYEMSGHDKKPILFFDEIQNIAHWDKFVRRLADAKYTIYVTGSNAKMLSSDVATTLGGRFLIYDVYPYNIQEYLRASSVVLSEDWKYSLQKSSQIRALFESYFNFGGLPETLYFKDKRSVLQSLYQKIYLGDICTRNSIRNSRIMGLLVKKMAESVRQPISYNRIQNIIKSTGNKVTVATVSEYVDYAIGSCLIFPIENGLAKISERESVKKYYFADNGLLNLFLIDAAPALLENLVAITLRQRYGKENVVYMKANQEIDFYVEKEGMAIQVSYSISDYDTFERETSALWQFRKQSADTRLIIITKDEKDIIEKDGHKIEVIPILDWLLDLK